MIDRSPPSAPAVLATSALAAGGMVAHNVLELGQPSSSTRRRSSHSGSSPFWRSSRPERQRDGHVARAVRLGRPQPRRWRDPVGPADRLVPVPARPIAGALRRARPLHTYGRAARRGRLVRSPSIANEVDRSGRPRPVRRPVRRSLYDLLYRVGAPWDGPPRAELVRLVEGGALTPTRLPPGRALDLGCGTGANLRYLARHGFEATGSTSPPVALRVARQRAVGQVPEGSIRLVEGDLTAPAIPGVEGSFDLLIDFGTLDDLDPSRPARDGASRRDLARPGRAFLFWCFWARPTDLPRFSLTGRRAWSRHRAGEALFGDAFRSNAPEPDPMTRTACFLMTSVTRAWSSSCLEGEHACRRPSREPGRRAVTHGTGERNRYRRGSDRWPCASWARDHRPCCGTACSSMNGPGNGSRASSLVTGAWSIITGPGPWRELRSRASILPRRLCCGCRRGARGARRPGARGLGRQRVGRPRWDRVRGHLAGPLPDVGHARDAHPGVQPVRAAHCSAFLAVYRVRRHDQLPLERDHRSAPVAQDPLERPRGGRAGARLPAHHGAAGARQRDDSISLDRPDLTPRLAADPLSRRVRHRQPTTRMDPRPGGGEVPAARRWIGRGGPGYGVPDPARGARETVRLVLDLWATSQA